MKKKLEGFTLLEIIIVVIVIGILATLGFIQYSKLIEKSRSAEAKRALGEISRAQVAYSEEYGVYATDFANLSVVATSSCTSTHYFSYSGDDTAATATRCSTGGKPPDTSESYTITLNYSSGEFGGSPGYY